MATLTTHASHADAADSSNRVLETAAERFLFQLRARGITHFFVNAGTDFAPIVEGYARLRDKEQDLFPQVCVAAHENLAVGMAHGAYLMTGRPQAVMFHVNVGTANAVCAAMNAGAERVPLLICAGRSPIYEQGMLGSRNTRVSWGQEMYDQAGIIREVVKWDYELRGPSHVGEVVDRALSIAQTEPKGPVYLTLPREVLAERLPPAASLPAASELPVPTVAAPDPGAVQWLADELVKAKFPVLSSMAGGADPASVAALSELCQTYAIGYVEEQARYLNLPSSHPLHLGYSLGPVLREADAICFVESDVPWIPEISSPKKDAFVTQCGVDPSFPTYPIRSHRSDLAITSGALPLYLALDRELAKRSGQIDGSRRARIAEMAANTRSKRAGVIETELGRDGPISNAYLSIVLSKVLHEGCTLFNEYWATREFINLDQSSSYFYLPATGGLGWALPAALGAKHLRRDRTFVAAVGDGTYMFSNPAACHHASQKHDLPVLTVICNNSRWNAVLSTTRLVYPQGHMSGYNTHALSDLSPSPAYEEYCKASGGFGTRVSEREQLEATLREALNVVEHEGRQAVVNVICA